MKEDAHRAAGHAGDALIYELPAAIEGFRVFTLFPNNICGLEVFNFCDGQTYREFRSARK